MRDAVRGHKAAAALLSHGQAEVTAIWASDGLECKGRFDWLRFNDIVDLKTTRANSLREFSHDCARYLYHGQVAWYADGAIAAGLNPRDADMPYIIAAQTVEPYDVWVLRVSGLAIEAGRNLCRELLAKYRACQAADFWPGIAPEEIDLELPSWAAGSHADEETW